MERRSESRRRRASLSDVQRAAAASALLTAVRPLARGRVAAYASSGTEPGTAPLLTSLPEVLLPVLQPDGDLDWALYAGELVEGLRGTLQPPGPLLGPDAIAGCTLVVVPALGVDRAGTRLGRGGGSYDRALARTRGYVVAALHEGELRVSLPTEPHDRPVDAAVLPDRGLVRLRPHPYDGLGITPGTGET
ncbi:MAG: 5-formyltetrahydrofolate cyclo-ligase [Frankiales bacterium]|nr:5-formyltetrahydrofolate cyclo-ligase [Frankiales bacterium]